MTMSAALPSLGASLDGALLTPTDDRYAATVSGYNRAVTHRPQLVVRPASERDVCRAVTFAADQGLPVSVQATGHGAARPATGMLIATDGLADVHIDPLARTATIAAGTRWQQVIEAAAPHGLAPLNGSSVDVGAVGYLLGGGLSPLIRSFGFAADHVRSIDLVTAEGRVTTVTADTEPELFWALRGGKPSVGIVTGMTIDLQPVSTVYGGGLYFAAEAAPAVLAAFLDWSAELPEAANTSLAILRLPDLPGIPEPLRGRTSLHLRYVYVGPAGRGAELVAPMRAAAPSIIDTIAPLSYTAIGSVHQDPPDPMPVWDSGMLLTELPPAGAEALLAVAGPQAEVPLIIVELRRLGGAASREPAIPNAVTGRDAALSAFVVGPMVPGMTEAVPAAGHAVLHALAPWSTGRCQVNMPARTADVDSGRLAAAAWDDATMRRLRAVKARFDPAGVFGFALDTGA